MFDFKNSGLSLRTMTPKDLGQFATDLNHNFMTILHAAGFKGMPGQSVTGPAGIGTRGTKWYFVSTRITNFTSAYGLTGGAQVTVQFLNTAMSTDQVKLAETVGLDATDTFVEGDMIVLTSGQVTQLEIEGPTTVWKDTGITFEQAINLTEDRVREIITSMIGVPSDNDSVLRRFAAVAKNQTDASPGSNTAINNDSLIDIPTSNSGPGVQVPETYFLAPKEQVIGTNMSLCLLAGSSQQYHDLVQRTQEALSNAYVPGIDDFAAGIFLQSSYKNGIVMGHKDSDTLYDFMRMYRTANALVIASHYTGNLADYSEIQLTKSNILLRATEKTLIESKELHFNGNKLLTRHFDYSGNTANIGSGNNAYVLNVYSKGGVYFRNIKKANFLSTDDNGKLVSLYKLVTNIYSATVSNTDIPTALSVKNALLPINTVLADHNIRITALENADTSDIFRDRGYTSASHTPNLNNFITEGNYVIAGAAVVAKLPADLHPDRMPKNETGTYYVDVYRVKGSTTDNIKQELTVRSIESSNRDHTKYFRFAYKTSITSTYTWTSWQRVMTGIDVSPFSSVLERIIELERKTEVFQTGGGMIFWNKPASEIPDGWREVINWRGRMPIGMNPSDPDFNTLGRLGGSKTAWLSTANLPAHSHGIRFRYSGAEQDNQIGFLQPQNWTDQTNMRETGGNSTQNGHVEIRTKSEGNGTRFPILNPYRTVLFIEYVGPSSSTGGGTTGGGTTGGGTTGGGTSTPTTTKPEAPTNLSGSSFRRGSAWLTWTFPSTSPIDISGFDILRKTGSGPSTTWTHLVSVTKHARFANVGSLTPGATYTFTIRARTATGILSDNSNEIMVRIADTDPHIGPIGLIP